MEIHTTTRHCELDQEVRLHAQQRLEKLGKFARDIREAHLTVTAERYRHSAEITLRLNHHELVSREEATEPRIAIDLAADSLEHQLRRFKEKRVGRKRGPKGGDGRSPAGNDGPTPGEESPGED
ncbi:MAG: ribosome-associated translation inhibitor RaiA [Candidatus Eisenbacteria bacterium]|uniref:Ribosome-associated translation inhibitor RaiA n=1 Tax=Eiseniibacteriota bacterium TaxID=2212470 RepID=A0A538SZF5_UNCEI|nr:MAG: ribosome-associated translation inhibitor RaiA [Candidatus Eisenbacteria bacterium]